LGCHSQKAIDITPNSTTVLRERSSIERAGRVPPTPAYIFAAE
jgi:hypothetical protein